MKTKDPFHIPWAFSLANAARLPLTGSLHPLRKEFTRWMSTANAFSLLIAIAIFSTWYVWSHRERTVEVVDAGPRIVKFTELGVPPSISQVKTSTPQVDIASAIAQPAVGVPEPVPDVEAQNATIATTTEMSERLAPVTASDLQAGGDSLIVDMSGLNQSKDASQFVAFDEPPVLLSFRKPVYPKLVRECGISGTVMVRVKVGKDGKVKDAVVVSGSDLLRDPAIDCAKSAIFKPAVQGTRPVEVWVAIPIAFELQATP